jgi:5-methylcytosine-specific restriction endonuclease McrA
MTSVTSLWAIIQEVLPSDRWMKVSEILGLVKNQVQLDDEDLEAASQWQASDLRWQRNVRNALQSHLDTDVERRGRGHYRLIRATNRRPTTSRPEPTDPPGVRQLKLELATLQADPSPQHPDVLRRIQRVLKAYERPSRIARYVKRSRGTTCQLCGELGFVMRNGLRYCEVHHLFHLSRNPPPKCLAPEYLVVLCATCHRRMHYAAVEEPVRERDGWRVRVDDTEYRFVVSRE